MAKLNGLYIFVATEDVSYGIDVTEYTVEEGIAISDHTKRRAMVLSISGEIVGKNAADTLSKIRQIHQSGTLCKYVGRNTMTNCLIVELSTIYTSSIWGGCEFSMTLKEIRTAASSYLNNSSTKSLTTGTQQVTTASKSTNVYHKVVKGDTIWALVAAPNAPYKKYGLSCDEVMKLNPDAFSRKGDFRTLQIGKKIIVGRKKV